LLSGMRNATAPLLFRRLALERSDRLAFGVAAHLQAGRELGISRLEPLDGLDALGAVLGGKAGPGLLQRFPRARFAFHAALHARLALLAFASRGRGTLAACRRIPMRHSARAGRARGCNLEDERRCKQWRKHADDPESERAQFPPSAAALARPQGPPKAR